MFSVKETRIKRFYSNRLLYDYIFNFHALGDFFSYDYRSPESYGRRLKDIYSLYDNGYREKLLPELLQYNMALGCGEETINNIGRLGRKDSVVVIGGQQPGLFTGPLFIIYKILTVIRLGCFIEEKFGMPVIPVFWNASDDSNLKQTDNIKLLDGSLHELDINIPGKTGKTRFSRILLKPRNYTAVLNEAEKFLKDTGFKKAVMDFFGSAVNDRALFSTGDSGTASISRFFSLLVLRLFKKWGIVVMEPDSHIIKSSSLDLISRDMGEHARISAILRSSGTALEDLGYHAQLKSTGDSLDFFIDIDGQREKVAAGNGQNTGEKSVYGDEYEHGNEPVYIIGGRKLSRTELMDFCTRNPENISLNVVTRPLLQDTILPVIATVCGPGEVSYFAQLGRVYSLMGMKIPVIYPRFSATIVEKKIQKQLQKLGLHPDKGFPELDLEKEQLLKKLINDRFPGTLEKAVENLNKDIKDRINRAKDSLCTPGTGMDLAGAFDRIKVNLAREVSVLEKKLYSAYKKQDDYLRESLDSIYLNMLPEGQLQERQVNIIYYLNKYSFSLIEEIYKCIEIMNFSHKFLFFQ